MSSLLNNASLLLNPAGSIISYQEDKIYSVLPRNGAGDFTFTGGDGGTRVNQDGYVDITPSNIYSYSEQFDNGYWQKYQVTVTSNAIANPFNGAITADRLDASGATTNNVLYKYTIPNTNPGEYTISAYFKLGAVGTTAILAIFGNTSIRVTFNLSTGEILWGTGGSYVAPTTYGIIDVGGGWYRCYATNPNNNVDYIYTDLGYDLGSSGYAYIFGAQINAGKLKPYQPTTDRLNYPRITYQNGRGALLSEPQRTNYALNSNSCAWATQIGASLTFSSSISPDGTQNATTLNVGTGLYSGTYYYVNRGTEVATVSIFAKAGTLPFIYFVNPAGNALVAWYDLRNGTVSNVNGSYTAYMEPYRDGWYRCVLVSPSQTNNFIQIGATDVSGVGAASYAGNIYIWGGQNEVGSYVTSYIPTTSATVTRPADSTNNTNTTNVASVVGQTEGVFYSDLFFEPNGAERNYMYLNTNGSYVFGFLYLVGTATNRLAVDIYNNPNTQQFSSQSPVLTAGRYKAAIAYKQNDFAFYLNGVQIGTDNSGTVPTLNRMYIGQGSDVGWTQGGPVFTTGFFPTRLTNTQLAELTTVRSGSGGTISYYGPYTIHTFTGSATFTPSFNGEVEVLVVAGGGSGAAGWGNGGGMGGGGAGGLLYASSFGVSQGTGITVTIGAGGAGTTGTTQAGRNGTQRGNPGSNTSFGGLTAIGGGGGAGDGATTTTMTGGSGGGGGYGSIGTGGAGTPGQGNNGGNHSNSNGFPNNYCGGGGGGAGVVGTPGTTAGGNGGNGLPYSISGFSTYYAGGGGGGTYASSGPGGAGVGGLGGGGNGGLGTTSPGQNGIAGVNFTGGAGGAGGCPGSSGNTGGNGGAGGSGVVIVRYLT